MCSRRSIKGEPKEVLWRDAKYRSVREDFVPVAYLANSQDPRPDSFAQILIRSNAPLTSLISSVKGVVRTISPDITVTFQGFQAMIRDSLVRDSLMATLSDFFGFLAALLVAVGVYGVTAYTVGRRTNEIGIRMALGADRREILRMILRETIELLAIGVVAGVVLALVLASMAGSLLYGVGPADPVTIFFAVLLLSGVALGASFLPARRAARLDPMAALRYE